MAQKLTNITNSFHSFAKDQVLTDTQLNEFLDYFDDQDRLSRICLSGVGIACGFKLSLKPDTNVITISKGVGVTTDGDLIHLTAKVIDKQKKERNALVDSIDYKYFRPYTSENVQYHPHFNSLDSNVEFNMIPLIEIVSEADKLSSDKELITLDLKNKIALFYLECYPKDPDNCVTVSCDSQGIEQVNRLRVLLVDIEDVDRITRPDSLFNSYLTLKSFLDIKTVHVPRIILKKANTVNFTKLAEAYQKGDLLTTSITNLIAGTRLILEGLNRVADANSFEENVRKLFASKDPVNLVWFQYKYDLLKDLADSYNELKELFLIQYRSCCPEIAAFPKHLLLGSPYQGGTAGNVKTALVSDQLNSDFIPNRHKFHKSPILLDSDDGNGRFESILTRMLMMVSNDGYFNRTSYIKEPIRITPSNVRVPLGNKAVPFYYKFSDLFMKNWDFSKRAFDRYKSILGYRPATVYAQDPYISDPLLYSIDPYDFYRIEGHQGQLYQTVFEELSELKNTYSLPFDIKVLGINITEFDELMEDQYKCDFKDLSVLLKAWSSEQECIAKEVIQVLSSFSTKDQGVNVAEENFGTVKGPRFNSQIEKLNIIDGRETQLNESLIGDLMTFRTAASSTNDAAIASADPSALDRVLGSINITPDTVGFYIDQAIKDSNGNLAIAYILATNAIRPQVDQWVRPVVESTIDLPLSIIISCTSLIDLVPNSINDLTEPTLGLYNKEIARLCSYNVQLQAKYRDSILDGKVTEKTRSMMTLLLNQLTTICCSSKKLQALLEEVENRKNAIVDRLNFTKFVENNPGLEHKAGAGPGQTFVLVYINNSKNSFSKSIVSNQVNIPKGAVVADFTLPYLCCSDCAPINFVMPHVPVSLSISDGTYCIDDANRELDLTISPIDGVVTVVDDVQGVIIDDGKLSIDGALFPTELLGTAIRFNVDGQETDAQLIVSKTPNVDFTFSDTTESRTVVFTVDGDDSSDFIYSWDFGDGQSSTLRNPTHLFETIGPAGSAEILTFDVTLTVYGLGTICPAVVTHTLTFEPQDVDVSLPNDTFCDDDEASYGFIFTPATAAVQMTGNGVNAAGTEFSPLGLDGGLHTLTGANGATVQVTIVQGGIGALNPPVVNVKTNTVTLSFTPIGGGSNPPTVEWGLSRNGVKLAFPASTATTFVIDLEAFGFEPGDQLDYSMILTSEFCGTTEDSGTVTIPGITTPCVDTMVAELTSIKSNAPSSSEIISVIKNTSVVAQINVMYVLLDDMLQQPDSVVAGMLNDRIAREISIVINALEAAMFNAEKAGDDNLLEFLFKLYRMALAIYANAFRCQDGFDFKDFELGNALNTILINQFDDQNANSFITRGYKVFDSVSAVPFLVLIGEKDKTTEPWKTIDFIMSASL